MNTELLKEVGEMVDGMDQLALMGSKYNNGTAEIMALQVILSCYGNYIRYNEAFSWYKIKGSVNNMGGLGVLLRHKHIEVGPYDNPQGLELPKGVVMDGNTRNPLVIRATDDLLNYVKDFLTKEG